MPSPQAPETRYIAQRILDGQFLHWDLPLSAVETSFALSGPCAIKGTLTPEFRELLDLGLDAWGVWIHAETDGVIRASGIVQPLALGEGEALTIEAVGFCGYLHGIPYLGAYSRTSLDPYDAVRAIWDHAQSFPEGKLGISVGQGATPIRLGTEKDDDGKLKPYELNWWNHPDCGQEVDKLAKATPFDFREHNAWTADRTTVEHRLELGYPRLGRKRSDLRFAQDENVTSVVPLREDADAYASYVFTLGKGEGRDAVTGYAGRRVAGRVRRVAIVEDKTIDTTATANAVAAVELTRRLSSVMAIESITIDTRHPNAPLGSFVCGDDVPVTAELPYFGAVELWHRITGYSFSDETDLAVVSLAPSDSFRYGGGSADG